MLLFVMKLFHQCFFITKLKDDPKFEEFVQAHQRTMNKSVWANDEAVPGGEVAEEGNEETRDTKIEEESKGEEEEEEEEEIEEEASGRCSVYKFWQMKIR